VLLIDISVAIVSTKITASRSQFLGILADEASAIWFLEHDARGAYGFLDVARSALSTHRRRRAVVIRRRPNAGKNQISMASRIALNERERSGVYGARTRNLRRDRAAL
jgi:hypothetical protein